MRRFDTPPHTHPHNLAPPRTLTLPAGSILLAGDSMDGRQIQWTGRKKAALYRQYSYGILLVQLCCTFGARVLHLWCQDAALLLALLSESLYALFSFR